MYRFISFSFVFFLFIAPIELKAGVIDFSDNPDHNYWACVINSSGFSFSSSDGCSGIGIASSLNSQTASDGSLRLTSRSSGQSEPTTIRMESIGSSLFSIASFDFASGSKKKANKMAVSLEVTGYDKNNAKSAYALFDTDDFTNSSLETIFLNDKFKILSSAVFTTTGKANLAGYSNTWAVYDNLNVDTVFEPQSLTLFTLAYICLIYFRRSAVKGSSGIRVDHSILKS